jgi:hypothetical protein
MTLFDFEELTAYWVEHPPLHILLGAYLGAGKHRRKPTALTQAAAVRAAGPSITALLAELGPGFGVGDVHEGLAPVVLDFGELQRRATAVD